MRFGYNFSNLCGTVYQCGNILFTPSGNEIISAVGSRVTVFNIVKHTSVTLPFESRALIKRMAMTPNGRLLLTIDEDGHSLCVDFAHRTVLYRFNFKKTPEAVEFSPNGKYFAITLGKKIQIGLLQVRIMFLHHMYYTKPLLDIMIMYYHSIGHQIQHVL